MPVLRLTPTPLGTMERTPMMALELVVNRMVVVGMLLVAMVEVRDGKFGICFALSIIHF
jgi:hypothetical protein